MARTFTSRVNLPSYDDMVKPLVAYKEAYDKQQAQYDAILADANQLNGLDPSSDAYRRYKEYSDSLGAALDDFSRGMTYKNSAALMGLKRGYVNDIVPINTAVKRKGELIAEQKKLKDSDPTREFDRDAEDISIDELVSNPYANYGKGYSGALMAQQVGQIASAFKGELTPGKIQELGLPLKYIQYTREGYSPEQIWNAIMTDTDEDGNQARAMLRGIVDNVLASNGATNLMGTPAYDRLWKTASYGLFNSVGGVTAKEYTDEAGLAAYRSNLDYNNHVRKALFDRELAKLDLDNDPLAGINLDSYSFLNDSGAEAKYLKTLEQLKAGNDGINSAYFGKDGKVNPLQVYDEIQSAISDIKENERNIAVGTGSPIDNAAVKTRSEAKKKEILEKYGVTHVISKDQYEALKAIGYNGTLRSNSDPSNKKYSFTENFLSPLDSLVQNYAYYTTNMSQYERAESLIKNQLYSWNDAGGFSGSVYEINSDGTKGDGVKFDNTGLDKANIVDVQYTPLNPLDIIVQLSNGKRYYVDANVLGDKLHNKLTEIKYKLDNGEISLRAAAMAGTADIIDKLRDANKTPSKTSSNV